VELVATAPHPPPSAATSPRKRGEVKPASGISVSYGNTLCSIHASSTTIILALIALLCSQPANAQAPEQFYQGKTLSLIIPNAPGGSFDVYARLVANHLGRFIPGNPSIVAQNMPGAAGMQAANYLYGIAPKDGTVLSVLVPNITLGQVLGVRAIAYDTRKFGWIGRVIATTATLFTWRRSQTRTIADLKTRETLVATTGAISQAEIDSTMLNGVVGTKFKLIRGYKGSGEAALAVERGEADGSLMPWEFIKSAHDDWLRDGKINLVVRYVRHPIAERPEVPSVWDLAESPEQRDVIDLFLGPDEMGQPIAAPPGVPRERLAMLRGAFDAMVNDPDFVADAAKRNLDLRPGRFDEIEKTVAEAFAASPAAVQTARKYYKQ
jgi:tripartite-type tricarboxylate transporter receptor subunit TctC